MVAQPDIVIASSATRIIIFITRPQLFDSVPQSCSSTYRSPHCPGAITKSTTANHGSAEVVHGAGEAACHTTGVLELRKDIAGWTARPAEVCCVAAQKSFLGSPADRW